MANKPLTPQLFTDESKTVLPAIDFYEEAQKRLPQIYNSAVNFMGLIFSAATIKQEIYDIIRSLCNVYNLYSSTSDNQNSAVPAGVYLKMLARDMNAPFSESDTDGQIFTSIVKTINLAISRGRPRDFYNYFEQNNLSGYFNNSAVQEVGNATIFFNVPIADNPLLQINAFEVFKEDMYRLKAAGIRVDINSTINIPYFQLADLDGKVAPGNAGFAGLNAFGQPLNGGFFNAQIPLA